MKKEFYLELSKTDVNGDRFSSEAAQSVAEQILGMNITSDSPEKGLLGEVIQADLLNNGTIRVIGNFIDGAEIPKNDIGTIGYIIQEFEQNGDAREVISASVYETILLSDDTVIEYFKSTSN